jgi:hypothetical protein
MLNAIITVEDIDVDVCLGDYDSFRTDQCIEVAYYKDGERLDAQYPKTMATALAAKSLFESGRYSIGEYGEVLLFT